MPSKKEVTLASLLRAGDKNWAELPDSDARRELGEILDFIGEAVVETAGATSDQISANEIGIINDAKGRLNEEVIRDIKLLFQEINAPELRDTFLNMMCEALLSAFVLGNYSTPSDAIWKLYASQTRRDQSSNARNALAATSSERQKKLNDAILVVCKPEELKAGEKFARRIRPKLLAHLGPAGEEDGWPSVSTIKAAISKIK